MTGRKPRLVPVTKNTIAPSNSPIAVATETRDRPHLVTNRFADCIVFRGIDPGRVVVGKTHRNSGADGQDLKLAESPKDREPC